MTKSSKIISQNAVEHAISSNIRRSTHHEGEEHRSRREEMPDIVNIVEAEENAGLVKCT